MMMPLTMATIGEVQTIKKVGGKQEVKLFLESLGFTTGATVTIVSNYYKLEGDGMKLFPVENNK